jgi:thiosulfate/3-mercaptopyruvate sulfurtransferase
VGEEERQKAAAYALWLIGEGADVDCAHAVTGATPLMIASACEGLDAVVARLIAAGATLDVVDENGGSALMFACIHEHAASAMLLIEAGAALNLAPGGVTVLDIADKHGLASVAAAIRARGGLTHAELAASRA